METELINACSKLMCDLQDCRWQVGGITAAQSVQGGQDGLITVGCHSELMGVWQLTQLLSLFSDIQ